MDLYLCLYMEYIIFMSLYALLINYYFYSSQITSCLEPSIRKNKKKNIVVDRDSNRGNRNNGA